MFLDIELSLKVAKLTNAQKHYCWSNARDAMLQLPGLFLLGKYVEGWLVLPLEDEVLVVEHGWVESNQERIVDPSLVLLLPYAPVAARYVAGYRLNWFQMQRLGPDAPVPIASLDAQDSAIKAGYKAAFDTAKNCAQQIANASGKKIQICPREEGVSRSTVLIILITE